MYVLGNRDSEKDSMRKLYRELIRVDRLKLGNTILDNIFNPGIQGLEKMSPGIGIICIRSLLELHFVVLFLLLT